MRLLHLGDTHLGAEMTVFGHPRGWRRAHDHALALHHALGPALRGEVDAVVHAGDCFDRSAPPTEAIAVARRLLLEAARRVPVVIIAGNHDRRGLRGHLDSAPPGLQVIDEATPVTLCGLRLGCIPYRREAAQWAEDAAGLARQGVDALLAHQSFEGSRVPGYVFRSGAHAETVGPAQIPPRIHTILCGHLHPRQAIELGETRIVHAGSTERTSFREGPAPKGAVIWSFQSSVEWRFLDFPSRPLLWVRSEVDLSAVTPGALVRVGPPRKRERAAPGSLRGNYATAERPPAEQRLVEELAGDVRRRGGWIVGERVSGPLSGQLGLFAAG